MIMHWNRTQVQFHSLLKELISKTIKTITSSANNNIQAIVRNTDTKLRLCSSFTYAGMGRACKLLTEKGTGRFQKAASWEVESIQTPELMWHFYALIGRISFKPRMRKSAWALLCIESNFLHNSNPPKSNPLTSLYCQYWQHWPPAGQSGPGLKLTYKGSL